MTRQLEVRPTSQEDAPELDLLYAQSYPKLLKSDYPPSVLVSAVPLIAKAQPSLVNSGTYYAVIDETKQILGAGGWTWAKAFNASETSPASAHIRHVVTHHRHVRCGVGRRLMAHIMAKAEAAGVQELMCQSTFTARSFYASCGFEEIRPIVVTLRPGIEFPAVLMRRALVD